MFVSFGLYYIVSISFGCLKSPIAQTHLWTKSHTHTPPAIQYEWWKNEIENATHTHTRISIQVNCVLCLVALCCETRNMFVLYLLTTQTHHHHWVVPFCVIHNTFTLTTTYYVYTFINKIRALNGHVFFLFDSLLIFIRPKTIITSKLNSFLFE